MERGPKESLIKYARKGGSILFTVGAGLALFKSNLVLAGAELVVAYFMWPKEKKGAGTHMAQSSGSHRVLESSSPRMALVESTDNKEPISIMELRAQKSATLTKSNSIAA